MNEIKSLEKEVMLYGFKSEEVNDLTGEVLTKVFINILGLGNVNFKAMKLGVARDDRPQAIRISFASLEARNSVLSHAYKLPKTLTLEKCMPRRYRNKNKEFKRYGWELKQVDSSLTTRTVFKGHKLVLEMKQKDEGENKFDWTIVKEYYPEPESPTPKNEIAKSRIGLKPSKTLEMIGKNYVFLSDINTDSNKELTEKYFLEVYLGKKTTDKRY